MICITNIYYSSPINISRYFYLQITKEQRCTGQQHAAATDLGTRRWEKFKINWNYKKKIVRSRIPLLANFPTIFTQQLHFARDFPPSFSPNLFLQFRLGCNSMLKPSGKRNRRENNYRSWKSLQLRDLSERELHPCVFGLQLESELNCPNYQLTLRQRTRVFRKSVQSVKDSHANHWLLSKTRPLEIVRPKYPPSSSSSSSCPLCRGSTRLLTSIHFPPPAPLFLPPDWSLLRFIYATSHL